MTIFSKFLLIALLLLGAIGCSKESTECAPAPDGQSVTITATAEQHDTRTSLHEGKVLWTAGDKIRVMRASRPTTDFVTATLKEGAGTSSGSFEASEKFDTQSWGLYPDEIFSSATSTTIQFKLPMSQNYVAGSFDNGANPMVGVSDAQGNNINFKNLCGAVRFQVTDMEGATLSQIGLYTPAVAPEGTIRYVAGTFTVEMPFDPAQGGVITPYEVQAAGVDLVNVNTQLTAQPQSFTLVVPAGVYAENTSFQLVTTDDKRMRISTKKRFTVERGQVTPIASFEFKENKEVIFPDEKFRNWLVENYHMTLNAEGNDIDVNCMDSKQKFSTTTSLLPTNCGITSLKGIEHFKALTTLDCSGNQLTKLEGVALLPQLQTLNCSNNKLSTLEVSKLTQLQTLNCSQNFMNKIDGLAALTQLQTLDCSKNYFNSIEGLSSLTKLETLLCNGCPINGLDISALSALKRLDCSHTTLSSSIPNSNRLGTLDVSKNTRLEYLKCNFNQIGALYLQNNPLIKELDCGNNKIMALTLAKTTNFTYFACNDNQITTNINLTGNRSVIAKGGQSALFVGNQQYFISDWGWYRMTVFISNDQADYALTETTNYGRNVLAEQIDNGALQVGSFYYEDGTWSYLLDKSKGCIGVVYEVNQARNGGKAVGLQTPPANWGEFGHKEGILDVFKGLLVEDGRPPSTINESGRVNMDIIITIGMGEMNYSWKYFPAFWWVQDMNGYNYGRWILPAVHELQGLYNGWNGGPGPKNSLKRDAFNAQLKAVGSTPLMETTYASSTLRSDPANLREYLVNFVDGSEFRASNDTQRYIRCIMEF